MKKLTITGARKYIKDTYGAEKKDTRTLVLACREIANQGGLKPLDVFFLLIENRPIAGAYTHSYGFQTASGRNIIESLQSKYYQIAHELNEDEVLVY
jgi:hypothetical protein